MDVSSIVRKVANRCLPNYLQAFDDGEELMASHKLTTPLRIAHFLAQALYETGRGTVLFENMNYRTSARLMEIFGVGHHSASIQSNEVPALLGNAQALAERVYGLGNPRKANELGNIYVGDGFRFRGGGLLQTTGRANYAKFAVLAEADLVNKPELIIDPKYALRPALGEWRLAGLNAFADQNDIRTITRKINGGYNGLKGREELFEHIWRIVREEHGLSEAWEAAVPTEETRWVQEALNNIGASPPLLVDGRYGPDTAQAVSVFQERAKVAIDGNAGVVTQAALQLRLDAA